MQVSPLSSPPSPPTGKGKAAGRAQVLALSFSNAEHLIVLKATWPGGMWWLKCCAAGQVNDTPALNGRHA